MKVIERIRLLPDLARVLIRGIPDRPGIAAKILSSLGEKGYNVVFVSSHTTPRLKTDLSLGIETKYLEEAVDILNEEKGKFGAEDILFERNVALLSLYGKKIATTPGIAGRIFSLLAEKGIDLEAIIAGVEVIHCLLSSHQAKEATELIKSEFT